MFSMTALKFTDSVLSCFHGTDDDQDYMDVDVLMTLVSFGIVW